VRPAGLEREADDQQLRDPEGDAGETRAHVRRVRASPRPRERARRLDRSVHERREEQHRQQIPGDGLARPALPAIPRPRPEAQHGDVGREGGEFPDLPAGGAELGEVADGGGDERRRARGGGERLGGGPRHGVHDRPQRQRVRDAGRRHPRTAQQRDHGHRTRDQQPLARALARRAPHERSRHERRRNGHDDERRERQAGQMLETRRHGAARP
jgi:hypothetical protein